MNANNQNNYNAKWFNPWRIINSSSMEDMLTDILNRLNNFESFFNKRKRKRRDKDKDVFKRQVEAVICDLTFNHLSQNGSNKGIAVIRRNNYLRSRMKAKSPVYNKTFPNVLDMLATPEMGFIIQELGMKNEFTGKSTIIKPGPVLLNMLDRYNIKKEDITIETTGKEPILLKTGKPEYWSKTKPVDYEDTETTINFREELDEINNHLKQSKLDLDRSVLSKDQQHLTVEDRFLQRIFTYSSFQSGGRLYGGFWQPLSKEQRQRGIKIDDKSIVTLDFKAMNPTMLYAMTLAGTSNHELESVGDLYSDDLTKRPGYKMIFNAMLFSRKRLNRFPRDTRKYFITDKRIKIEDVCQEIEDKHYLIKDYFYNGIGHYLQFLESNIMTRILLRLINEYGVTALPIHDAIIIPNSYEDIARKTMTEAFIEHTSSSSITPMITKE